MHDLQGPLPSSVDAACLGTMMLLCVQFAMAPDPLSAAYASGATYICRIRLYHLPHTPALQLVVKANVFQARARRVQCCAALCIKCEQTAAGLSQTRLTRLTRVCARQSAHTAPGGA